MYTYRLILPSRGRPLSSQSHPPLLPQPAASPPGAATLQAPPGSQRRPRRRAPAPRPAPQPRAPCSSASADEPGAAGGVGGAPASVAVAGSPRLLAAVDLRIRAAGAPIRAPQQAGLACAVRRGRRRSRHATRGRGHVPTTGCASWCRCRGGPRAALPWRPLLATADHARRPLLDVCAPSAAPFLGVRAPPLRPPPPRASPSPAFASLLGVRAPSAAPFLGVRVVPGVRAPPLRPPPPRAAPSPVSAPLLGVRAPSAAPFLPDVRAPTCSAPRPSCTSHRPHQCRPPLPRHGYPALLSPVSASLPVQPLVIALATS
jgi:hypothetical protein